MDLALNNLNLPLLMDGLALCATTILIIVLVANRRRYGRLIGPPAGQSDFTSSLALQMLTAQSQRSYSRIQRTLHQEFACLQRMAGSEVPRPATASGKKEAPTAAVSQGRTGLYDEAVRMMRNGADQQTVAARCELTRGEIELMAYMQHKRS